MGVIMTKFIEVTSINSDGKEMPMLCNVAHIISAYASARPSPRHHVQACLTLIDYDDPICVKETYHAVRAAIER
jgi:hypothetical protein